MQVVDYSFSHPDPASIVSSGFVGAVRYLSNGQPPKDLTIAERDALHEAGALIALVFETTANRAGQGHDVGARDAMRANQLADALGWPNDRPIRYAVDFQATWDQVRDYFAGARSTGGRPVSVYGCYDVIEGAAADGYGWLWQCAAWSGNGSGSGGSIQGRRVSAHAVLYQLVGYVLGDSSDANDVLADDWGGWHPDHPIPPTPPEEDSMAMPEIIVHRSGTHYWHDWRFCKEIDPSVSIDWLLSVGFSDGRHLDADTVDHILEVCAYANTAALLAPLLGAVPGAPVDVTALMNAIHALPAETVAAIRDALSKS